MIFSRPSSARRSGRIRTAIAVSLTAAVALTGCAGAQAADGGADTLIIGLPTEPTVFDPNRQYSYDTFRIDRHIYETLITEDLSTPAADGTPELIPGLAEEWEVSDDGRVFTFHLREGVSFSDGTPFDAAAVEFNVKRFTDPEFEYFDEQSQAVMAPIFENLESFEVLDESTVAYTFADPFLAFPRYIAQGNYVQGIISPEAIKTYGNDGIAENPVGTGPYVFVERQANDHTTLERNEDYWGEAPVTDRLVFRTITDEAARATALKSGEVDVIAQPPSDAIADLEASGFALPDNGGAANLDFYSFNWANEAVRDVRVRQAIIHAIDREGLVETVYSGYAVPAQNIYNEANEAYDPEQTDYDYDPEKARELLAEAGYGEGELSLTISTYQPKPAEFIQSNLEAVGIDVEVRSSDWITFSQNIAAPDEDVALQPMQWGLLTPDWLRVAYRSYVVRIGGGQEFIDQGVADAILAASVNGDASTYVSEYQSANELAQQQALFIPLATPNIGWAHGPNVTGFVSPAQNWVDFTTVGLDAA